MIELLESLVKPERGGRPSFTLYHIYVALRELRREPLGRPTLSRVLELSDSSVKTLLARLEKRGLVARSRGGAYLTEAGAELLDWLESRLSICETSLSIEQWGRVAVITVACVNPPVREVDALAYRDFFISAGCSKAMIGGLVEKRITMPGLPPDLEEKISSEVSRCVPRDRERLVAIVSYEELSKACNALLSVFKQCL
ncbi:MAG: hypothetical protein QXS85_03085 [Acidilobaceae archaeon]